MLLGGGVGDFESEEEELELEEEEELDEVEEGICSNYKIVLCAYTDFGKISYKKVVLFFSCQLLCQLCTINLF